MSLKPLTASETSVTLRARILGLTASQVVVTDRLTALGVPASLLDAVVVHAKNDDQAAMGEAEIINWYAAEHKLADEAVLRVLNGQTTLDVELSQQEAA